MPAAPALFISHGAPTFAIEPGRLGPRLGEIGRQLAGDAAAGSGQIKAVLVVSPHWQTRDLRVMTTPKPETVHDFGGFPSELYDLHYPAPGHPQLAAQARCLLAQTGLLVSEEARRGLDHGAWVPLMHMLPQAQLPVFQVSMPFTLTTSSALALGRALAPLRAQGVLIVASGSMTHNLHEFGQGSDQAADYVVEFTHWVRQAVQRNDIAALIDYRARAPHAQRAHPTEEHFLPLLVALGTQLAGETALTLDGGVDNAVLSMESYAWGMPD